MSYHSRSSPTGAPAHPLFRHPPVIISHCHPPALPPTPCAGIPLSIIVKEYGWGAYFSTLVAACALALLLLSPMTRLRSYVQREAARKEREAAAGKVE